MSSEVPGVQVILMHANLTKHNKQLEALLATSDPSVSTPNSESDRGHATLTHTQLSELKSDEKKNKMSWDELK